jgi:hypothetical protein
VPTDSVHPTPPLSRCGAALHFVIPNEAEGSAVFPFSNEGWVPHCPDFLWILVALIHSMRLFLMKGAHPDLSSTAWQEIGVKPFFGLSGTPQLSTRLFCDPACQGVPWERTSDPG